MTPNLSKIYNQFLLSPKISTDSRTIINDSIFFALKGENFNGNKFAAEALEKGAALSVVDEKDYCDTNDSRIILVDDSLKTLQELAIFHRSQFQFPVIGITGTNGKTTTKELVAGVLSLKYRVKATSGNLNNHIGVPLTILSVDKDNTDFCIVEMGANHVGEIAALCEIAKPNYGLITSIGKAHLEGFGSLENIIKTKLELYDFIAKNNGTLFVNSENEILMNNLPDVKCVFYGENGEWRTENGELIVFDSKMYGKYNLTNMLAAACVGNFFEVPGDCILFYLNNYSPENNRSQVVKIGNNTIISDAYNANPSSMEIALDEFDLLDAEGKILVIGDMFELGEASMKEHEIIVDRIRKIKTEKVFLVGKTFSELNSEYESFLSVDELIKNLDISKLTNKTILIKGSRAMKLEKLIKLS